MAHVVVALDLPSTTAALGLVDELGDSVAWYKVGSPLFTRCGPAIVRELRARGRNVFLDLKYHDIPNTVAHAVETAAALDVQLLTLHATGGVDMLRAARDAIGSHGPRLIAVTLLTSLGPEHVEIVWDRPVPSVQREVLRLAALARDAGLDGVVASPLETAALRQAFGPEFLVVNPGIRPGRSATDDQTRTSTPAGATRAGADFLVVGRPVLDARDRPAALEALLAEVHDASVALPR
jgi:orotidine-5'-phosphate decarboxylase